MVFEHEIPNGSRLYFGKTAKQKRDLESLISTFLYKNSFEEIITPSFSYSQHQCLEDSKKLITIFDEHNEQLSLRADSTLDVVRIITKRLGRTTKHKKWFYIQPVFKYPSAEEYQIGVEWIDHNNMSDIIKLNANILNELKITPIMQISNVNIPQLVCNELNVDIDIFRQGRIDMLLAKKCEWLSSLVMVKTKEDLEKVSKIVPKSLEDEVLRLLDIVKQVDYANIVVAPLYYGSRKYYDGIYYRVIENNQILCMGGAYKSEEINSLGFALYTDNLLNILED